MPYGQKEKTKTFEKSLPKVLLFKKNLEHFQEKKNSGIFFFFARKLSQMLVFDCQKKEREREMFRLCRNSQICLWQIHKIS